jgi:hypothetical protein
VCALTATHHLLIASIYLSIYLSIYRPGSNLLPPCLPSLQPRYRERRLSPLLLNLLALSHPLIATTVFIGLKWVTELPALHPLRVHRSMPPPSHPVCHADTRASTVSLTMMTTVAFSAKLLAPNVPFLPVLSPERGSLMAMLAKISSGKEVHRVLHPGDETIIPASQAPPLAVRFLKRWPMSAALPC